MPLFIDPTQTARPGAIAGGPAEIAVDFGWPSPQMTARPGDAIGEAIVEFAEKWRDHPGLQADPWDPRTGEINLLPPDEARPAADERPRYKMKADGFIGPALYAAGQEVTFDGWPKQPWSLEPVNESAERVLRYQSTYGHNGALDWQPYSDGKLDLRNPAIFGRPADYRPQHGMSAGFTAPRRAPEPYRPFR